MYRFLQILFWSVISAAFIGPGTVTTAASSGAHFHFSLIWALVFSTTACLILQEASARLTIISGKTLGQALKTHFPSGIKKIFTVLVIVGAILLGCAAYEAGNILGGVAGFSLISDISRENITLLMGMFAVLLLWFGNTRYIAQLLGGLVALMGLAFLATALMLQPSFPAILSASFIPSSPEGSGLYILGLIGTTVVPYNLFLGSGLAVGAKIKDMRFGLSIAIIFGGIISIAVLIVGTSVSGQFSFQALAAALSSKLGQWAGIFFAVGLLAAGFSSAITAPLAAAITARSIFENGNQKEWHETGWKYRSIWMAVLLTGVVVGISGFKPIPIIIVAQALNGVLLPMVAIFLFLMINNRKLMGNTDINGALSNIFMVLIVLTCVLLGTFNLIKAGSASFGFAPFTESTLLLISSGIALLLAIPIYSIFRKNR